jgi:hypothetical protein
MCVPQGVEREAEVGLRWVEWCQWVVGLGYCVWVDSVD